MISLELLTLIALTEAGKINEPGVLLYCPGAEITGRLITAQEFRTAFWQRLGLPPESAALKEQRFSTQVTIDLAMAEAEGTELTGQETPWPVYLKNARVTRPSGKQEFPYFYVAGETVSGWTIWPPSGASAPS